MRGRWWKVASIILLLYVVIAGMLVPLKPGITGLSTYTLTTGQEAVFEVYGYNTHFTTDRDVAGPPRVWVRLSAPKLEGSSGRDTALLAQRVEVISPQALAATFVLPDYLPVPTGRVSASVIVDSPLDGPLVLPGGMVMAEPESLTGPRSIGGWDDQILELSTSDGMTYPYRGILGETIRNQYFHVSLWFALMLLMLGSAVYAARYLLSGREEFDLKSQGLTRAGFLFGILGLLTGMVWANYTWGAPWSGDIKQNMTAIALLIYGAYFVLRSTVHSEQQGARLGAAYNLFAFAMLIPLLYIIPRMYDSLHPGNGGNPGFGGEDLDNTMRMVFYPGILGFTLFGLWLSHLWSRAKALELKLMRR